MSWNSYDISPYEIFNNDFVKHNFTVKNGKYHRYYKIFCYIIDYEDPQVINRFYNLKIFNRMDKSRLLDYNLSPILLCVRFYKTSPFHNMDYHEFNKLMNTDLFNCSYRDVNPLTKIPYNRHHNFSFIFFEPFFPHSRDIFDYGPDNLSDLSSIIIQLSNKLNKYHKIWLQYDKPLSDIILHDNEKESKPLLY